MPRMRIRRKAIISSLALLAGASLIGSVTGTIAWYQYSISAQVALEGTTAHCSKLLQISIDDGDNDVSNNVWGNDFGTGDLPNLPFSPVTTGEINKDDPLSLKTIYEDDHVTPKATSLFYAAPSLLQGEYDNWLLAADDSYVQFSILVKVKDIDKTESNLANDVYLTDLTIQDASNSNVDLSSAIRVHFSVESPNSQSKNFLFAKDVEETEVGGFLDMDGNKELDYAGYEWEPHPCLYGGGTVIPITETNPTTGEEVVIGYDVNPLMQYSYTSTDSNIIASETREGDIVGGTPLGKTSANPNEYLKITVTIWLEGWSPLLQGVAETTHNSVWDNKEYLEKSFNVGMTFGVKLHTSEE